VAAREVPAPRYGFAGLCRSFPEPAFLAQAFLGMRSQGCWFGEPARMVGIWGKCMGPLLWLTPSAPTTGSEAATGMGLGSPGWLWRGGTDSTSLCTTYPGNECLSFVHPPSPSLPREDASLAFWQKKGWRNKTSSQRKPARARSEPCKSLAHTSRVKRAERAVCVKVNTGCTCPQAPVRGSTIDGLFLS